MPAIQIPRIAQPILNTKARIIVLMGGRSSAKSETVGRETLKRCQTEAADVLCGREYQNSIDESVHKLYKSLIENIPIPGFHVGKTKIECLTGGGIRFRGLDRSPTSIQSYQDFKYFWGEEAHAFSQDTIDIIIPTFRSEGSKLYFTANPQSSADPFSKRFILPFLGDISAKGFYEDEMHLIIKMNWRDNPWHGELETQRIWDLENLTRAKYDWIWEGAFNDSVEDALILAEWFDACINAHKKLGFKPEGIRFSSHDPSDTGPDNKGFAHRHGSVITELREKTNGDINEGGDWALGLAIMKNSDAFTWDCDGMGVGLNRQVTRAFNGKPIVISMFKGSNAVDFPEALFDPMNDSSTQNRKTNKDALKNMRAQYYFALRQRIYRTYLAVEKGEYQDPDTLLSIDGDLLLVEKLRSELCRMPIKPNSAGKFELYSKPEMKSKFKFPSPNLSDSVMMLMRTPHVKVQPKFIMPQPIKPLGWTTEIRGRRSCR